VDNEVWKKTSNPNEDYGDELEYIVVSRNEVKLRYFTTTGNVGGVLTFSNRKIANGNF
jgi:hypothetical protein